MVTILASKKGYMSFRHRSALSCQCFSDNVSLFGQEHLACDYLICEDKAVEINATAHFTSLCVTTIPDHCMISGRQKLIGIKCPD